jgi:hypothetical protein
MTKKILINSLIILSCIYLLACNSSYFIVQKSEGFKDNKEALKKSNILYFEPELRFVKVRKEVEEKLSYNDGIQKEFKKTFKKISNKKNISIGYIDLQNEKYAGLYVNELQDLKKEILRSVNLQNNPLNNTDNSGFPTYGLKQNVFVYPIKLNTSYSKLSSIIDTKYIGLTGIFALDVAPQSEVARDFVKHNADIKNGQFFYHYNIIVNIERAEIEYFDFKKVDEKFRKTYIEPVIYDSFYVLNKNLKK